MKKKKAKRKAAPIKALKATPIKALKATPIKALKATPIKADSQSLESFMKPFLKGVFAISVDDAVLSVNEDFVEIDEFIPGNTRIYTDRATAEKDLKRIRHAINSLGLGDYRWKGARVKTLSRCL